MKLIQRLTLSNVTYIVNVLCWFLRLPEKYGFVNLFLRYVTYTYIYVYGLSIKSFVFSLFCGLWFFFFFWKCGSNKDIYKILQEKTSSDWVSYLIIYFLNKNLVQKMLGKSYRKKFYSLLEELIWYKSRQSFELQF